MRHISEVGDLTMPKGARPSPGERPTLKWLPIANLVVDETYQRPIKGAGRRSVRRIAEGFNWAMFAPVVVSPMLNGLFAIVDGQHRATAAFLAGIPEVPCQIIVASQKDQAKAFAAINGNVTRISALALHRAAVASGETQALAIERAAAKANVTILAYPKSELNQEPGETLAIGTIAQCLRLYGEEVVVLALRCVVETRNKVRGGLLSAIIAANSAVIHKMPVAQRRDHVGLIAAFDRINLIREFAKAQTTERPRGTAIYSVLTERVRAALSNQRIAA